MVIDEILRRIKLYGGEVLFKKGELIVINASKGFFWDVRNYHDEKQDLFVVYPLLLEGKRSIWYVCPFCSELHLTDASEFKEGKTYFCGCIGYVNKRSKKMMIRLNDGQGIKIKRPRFIVKKVV